MKTKFIFLILVLSFSFRIFAQNSSGYDSRVIDNAGLLNPNQKTQLEGLIAAIIAEYNFDLVILTERNTAGTDPEEYADSFFEFGGFGGGLYRDGSILLQVTEGRDYVLSSSGRGERILNEAAFNKLEDDAAKHLRRGEYFEAYRSFILNWEKFLILEAKGRNYNFFERWNLVIIIVSWVSALAIAFWVLAGWKSKMDTALAQTQADAYTIPGSLVYKIKSDKFLYSTVTKTRREKQSSGGKSTSSSGRNRGGKY